MKFKQKIPLIILSLIISIYFIFTVVLLCEINKPKHYVKQAEQDWIDYVWIGGHGLNQIEMRRLSDTLQYYLEHDTLRVKTFRNGCIEDSIVSYPYFKDSGIIVGTYNGHFTSVIIKDTVHILETGDYLFDSSGVHKIPEILVIGHSWAVGAFKGYEQYFEKYNINLTVISKKGSSINWATNQIKHLKKDYDIICLLTGINDYRNGSECMINDFKECLHQIDKTNTKKVYLYNIPDYPPAKSVIINVNNWLRSKEVIKFYKILDINKEYKGNRALHPKSYKKCRELLKEKLDG